MSVAYGTVETILPAALTAVAWSHANCYRMLREIIWEIYSIEHYVQKTLVYAIYKPGFTLSNATCSGFNLLIYFEVGWFKPFLDATEQHLQTYTLPLIGRGRGRS